MDGQRDQLANAEAGAAQPAPLMRAGLVKTGQGNHWLLVDIHHIVSDGTSMEIFQEELPALYCDKELVPLPIQYKDYLKILLPLQNL